MSSYQFSSNIFGDLSPSLWSFQDWELDQNGQFGEYTFTPTLDENPLSEIKEQITPNIERETHFGTNSWQTGPVLNGWNPVPMYSFGGPKKLDLREIKLVENVRTHSRLHDINTSREIYADHRYQVVLTFNKSEIDFSMVHLWCCIYENKIQQDYQTLKPTKVEGSRDTYDLSYILDMSKCRSKQKIGIQLLVGGPETDTLLFHSPDLLIRSKRPKMEVEREEIIVPSIGPFSLKDIDITFDDELLAFLDDLSTPIEPNHPIQKEPILPFQMEPILNGWKPMPVNTIEDSKPLNIREIALIEDWSGNEPFDVSDPKNVLYNHKDYKIVLKLENSNVDIKTTRLFCQFINEEREFINATDLTQCIMLKPSELKYDKDYSEGTFKFKLLNFKPSSEISDKPYVILATIAGKDSDVQKFYTSPLEMKTKLPVNKIHPLKIRPLNELLPDNKRKKLDQ